MPSPEQLATVAKEWILKADEDLLAASHLLKAGEECPTATIGFHAQQCVEKCLKAVLVLKSIEFPKTHDIEKLVGLLPLDVVITLPIADQRILSVYGTVTRYPGDYEPVTVKEARRAVSMARRVRRSIRTEFLSELKATPPSNRLTEAERDLKGVLHRPRRKPVSPDAMRKVIRQRGSSLL